MIYALALLLAHQGSLLQDVVPQPTGKNGYEEYLRAADIERSGDANLYLNWKQGTLEQIERAAAGTNTEPKDPLAIGRLPLARQINRLSTLELRKETLLKFGLALDWVKQGNAKPVFDPWTGPTRRHKLPEFRHFRDLAQLAVVAAYVRDAEGRTAVATDGLLQVIEMGDRIGGIQLVGLLNGVLMQTTAVAGMSGRLERMSREDALATVKAMDKILARTPSIIEALLLEIGETQKAWREMLRSPVAWPPDVASKDPKGDRVAEALARMSEGERSRLVAYLEAFSRHQRALVQERFSGPEAMWVTSDPVLVAPRSLSTIEEVGDALLASTVSPPRSFGISAARVRTQLRLLRLAARVVVFKWDHERLPARLEDAAPLGDIKDPLSADHLQYQPLSDRFRVWSKGVAVTGEIELRYEYPAGSPPPTR